MLVIGKKIVSLTQAFLLCHVGIPLLTTAFTKGWFGTICKPYKSELFEENVTLLASQPAMWAYIFCLSKLPELFDTLFVVLRKQKLILLHWYHHITVMVYCYFHVAYMVVPGQWFVVMNYFVHSVMYSYYAIRATGLIRPPKWVMMVITALQLSQMAVGVWINIYIFRMMSTTPDFYCDERIETSYFYVNCAFAMYLSYLILFLHFFYTTYLKKEGARGKNASGGCTAPSVEQISKQDYRRNGDVVTSAGNGALHKRK